MKNYLIQIRKGEKQMKKISFLVLIGALLCLMAPTFTNATICGQVYNYNLTAGQTINVGGMSVWNDDQYLYVVYKTDSPWYLKETHLHVGCSLSDIPVNKKGIPVPGQFDYQRTYNPVVSQDTYKILLSSLPCSVTCGNTSVVIVSHAEVVKKDGNGTVIQNETAFGGPNQGPGPRWWFYINYTIQCCGGGGDLQCETAWARLFDDASSRIYDFPCENWATYVIFPATENSATYYLYAGQWYKVGTLTVVRDASNLTVTYSFISPYKATETHLAVEKALADIPQTNNGCPKNGNFAYKSNNDPGVSTVTYTIPLTGDTDGVDLYIAAHAKVCAEHIP